MRARERCLVLLVLGAALLGLASGVVAQPASMTLRATQSDGRLDLEVTALQLGEGADWYLAGADVAEMLQAGRFWRSDVRKLVLRVQEQRVTFTVGARSVVGASRTMLLHRPVLFHEGQPWMPLEFLTDILPELTQIPVSYDAEGRSLRIGDRPTNVLALRIESSAAATEVRLDLGEVLAFRVDDSRTRHLVVKIYGGTVDPTRIGLGRPRGLVDGVTSRQEDGFALLDVKLGELAQRYQSVAEADGKRILLRIEPLPVSTIPEPQPRGPHLVQTLPPEARGRKVDVRKVVIDPGHGGVDVGATGRADVQEKDITLAVARELARTLRDRNDIEAVLTRGDDSSLGLVERTEFANREGADLFVSLHCNAWFDPAARGVETYFLSPAKSEWDADVARKENSSAGTGDDLDFILWDLVQNAYIQESATLAEAVQAGLVNDTGLRNRGVKQAGFRVLVGAFMPAILVEMGFISNGDDAKALTDRREQRRIARALADAIVDFRARMDAIREESR
jgi:N-acetylmuramoyl-L-alanine amidase